LEVVYRNGILVDGMKGPRNTSNAGNFSSSGRFGTAGSSIDGRRANQASGFRSGSAAALAAERQKLPRTFFDQLQTGPALSQGHAATRP
jgi:hypothetical protein